MKKVLQILKNILVWLIMLTAVCMMVFTFISVTTFDRNDRQIFGYRAYIVNSDSMAKTDFDAGDLILVKEVDPNTLEEGDIITFVSQNEESFGETVTHKIRTKTFAEDGQPGFITYGTTTGNDDAAIVTYMYILGKYELSIPHLGTFYHFLKTPQGYVVCIFVPFMILILYYGMHSIRLFRAYRKEQQAAVEAEREKIELERAENARMLAELQQLKAKLDQQSQRAEAAPVPSDTPTE